MKQIIFSFLCTALIISGTKSLAQPPGNSYTYSKITYPVTNNPVTSFSVNENGQVFLSLNGGIYLPKDSLWFIPPSHSYYFTCFAPNLKDTSLFVIANSSTYSELYYLKSSFKSSIKKCLLAKLEKGIYRLIYKNDICYVWGNSNRSGKIGILVENDVKWLLNLEGNIKQVQINDSAEIFFAYKNTIYKLSTREAVLTLNKTIYGFAFDANNDIFISCPDGIGIKKDDKLNIIATNAAGPIEYMSDSIFILNRNGNEIIQLKLK